jgi:VanZ family protein
MNKKIAYIIYAWGSTIILVGAVFWLATVPHLADQGGESEELFKILYRIILYAFVFLLIYRSLLATFRITVKRLSAWHSKKEKSEDTTFVLIIETLLVIIAVLSSSIISIIDEYIQNFVEGRSADIEDVLISILGILLSAMIVYSSPVLGEAEMFIKHRFFPSPSKKEDTK